MASSFPTEPPINPQHKDSKVTWVVVFFVSVTIHLFVFWLGRFGIVSVRAMEQEQDLIPIDVVSVSTEDAPEKEVSPPYADQPLVSKPAVVQETPAPLTSGETAVVSGIPPKSAGDNKVTSASPPVPKPTPTPTPKPTPTPTPTPAPKPTPTPAPKPTPTPAPKPTPTPAPKPTPT
ncbi:MAG TPA: hypothetical protein V6D13_06980, partial [Halomicronema sp.]